jgi:hypothetical protein
MVHTQYVTLSNRVWLQARKWRIGLMGWRNAYNATIQYVGAGGMGVGSVNVSSIAPIILLSAEAAALICPATSVVMYAKKE